MKAPGLVLVAALLAATCAGTAPSATPSAAQSTPTTAPSATLAPQPSATLAPQPSATLAPQPIATPTLQATATPTPRPQIETPPPLSPQELLISYTHPDLRDTCEPGGPIYETEVASISCGTEELPFDYSLFASVNELRAAFREDVDGAETPPEPDGTCEQGNYEAIYERDGGPVGRVNCREHTSDSGFMFHVLEWTNEPLLVIGYISNNVDAHSWAELIAFWEDQAGPFPPD